MLFGNKKGIEIFCRKTSLKDLLILVLFNAFSSTAWVT